MSEVIHEVEIFVDDIPACRDGSKKVPPEVLEKVLKT